MKIRLIGSGYPFCRHPLVPVTLLVQTTDGGNLVVNCPPQVSAKLESISMSLSDIDVWVLTSPGVFSSGGLEEVCNTQLRKQTVLSGLPAVMDEVKKKFDPKRGSNKRLSEVSAPSVRLQDEHFEERIIFKSNGVLFEKSQIVLTDIHGISSVANAELILCNVANGSDDLSIEFDYLRQFPIYIQQKIWVVGYGNSYQDLEDPFPIMFMPQGACLFDSERKDRYIDKRRLIVNEGRRIAGNKSRNLT